MNTKTTMTNSNKTLSNTLIFSSFVNIALFVIAFALLMVLTFGISQESALHETFKTILAVFMFIGWINRIVFVVFLKKYLDYNYYNKDALYYKLETVKTLTLISLIPLYDIAGLVGSIKFLTSLHKADTMNKQEEDLDLKDLEDKQDK